MRKMSSQGTRFSLGHPSSVGGRCQGEDVCGIKAIPEETVNLGDGVGVEWVLLTRQK